MMGRPCPGRLAHAAAAGLLLAHLALLAAWPALPAGPLRRAGEALYPLLCHQRPERCYRLAGGPLPVCARCLGVWAGLACGALLGLLGSARRRWWSLPGAGLLLGVLASGWLLGRLGLPGPDAPPVRTATGLLGGVGLYVLGAIVLERFLALLSRCLRGAWGRG
jgi:uncharacterized membrane protein